MTLNPESGKTSRVCNNCGAAVAGQKFCAQCGQKADTHIFSIRELLEEFADGLFNLDSRVWRSLLPLVIHPGKLTTEYLAGKRLHYLPPFRLYLILSLLFFFIPNNINLGKDFNQQGNLEIDASNIPTGTFEQLDDNESSGQILEQMRREFEADTQEFGEEDNIYRDGECNLSGMNQDSLFTALVLNACLMVKEDSERFFEQLEDSIPVMMLAGLPLVALIMQLFYAFSGRYYVEHVIFLFHVHGFYFFISILMSVSSLLGQAYGILLTPMNWFRILGAFYIPVYIYLAMKNVYGESGLKTFTKAFFLLIGYMLCIGIVMTIGALITAMSL